MAHHLENDELSKTHRFPRSVKDYKSEADLLKALSRVVSIEEPTTACKSRHIGTIGASSASIVTPVSSEPDPELDIDWRVDSVDRDRSYEQTVEREMSRLLVLKSYLELDYEAISARDCAFDNIAGLAKRAFNVPACFVFLVDIGRSWALSQEGKRFNLVSRKDTICSHVIVSTADCFIVPDAANDHRFQNSAFVAAENGVRFYAACSLKSSEGFNIGTFSITDTKPRYDFSMEDQDSVKKFAKLTMDTLFHQRELYRQRGELISAAQRLARTSHDLLTPLSVVQLSVSLLNQDSQFLKNLNDRQRECIKAVASSSEAMSSVCKFLKNDHYDSASPRFLSMATRGVPGDDIDDATVGRAPICIKTHHLVLRLKELTSALTINKSISLSISVDKLVPNAWVGNKVQIMHLCLQLVANAIQRTVKGHVLFNIGLDDASDHRRIVFECTDSAGCSSDDAPGCESIFRDKLLSCNSSWDPVDRATTDSDDRPSLDGIWSAGCTQYSGMYETFPSALIKEGQAASFSSKIRSLGGSFGVVTGPGVPIPGTTTFWFALPLLLPSGSISVRKSKHNYDEACGQTLGGSTDPAATRARRALVVDDSVTMRKMLCRALVQLDFDTTQAADGLEGLRRMQEQTYDLVLLDFLMPVMDGLDCIRAYRQWEAQHRPGFRQAVCGISAHASSGDVGQGLASGMTDYCAKPLSLYDLQRLADGTLKRRGTKGVTKIEKTPSMMSKTPPDSTFRTSLEIPGENICLVAIPNSDGDASELDGSLEGSDWIAVVVGSSEEALQLLRARHWGAVLLDKDLPGPKESNCDSCGGGAAGGGGLDCLRAFRAWEERHRVRRQRHVLLTGHGLNRGDGDRKADAADAYRVTQLAGGIDAAVPRPRTRAALASLLAGLGDRAGFGERDIVTR